ncbi:MAG: hypothetical protein ABEH80_09975, partial [Halobaculum sp.]
FDTDSGAVSEFTAAVSAVDWDAVERERAAVDPTATTVTDSDLAAIDDLLALETVDLTAVSSAVAAATAPVARLGLDRLVDVTGGQTPPSQATFWYATRPSVGDVRARVARVLDNPAVYNEGAPAWMLSYHHATAATLRRVEAGQLAAAYLDAFLSAPGWLPRYLDRHLDGDLSATTLLSEVTAWLYSPADIDDRGRLAAALDTLADAVTDAPALSVLFDGLSTIESATPLRTFAVLLGRVASAVETEESGQPSDRSPSPESGGRPPAEVAEAAFDDRLTAAVERLTETTTAAEPRIGAVLDSGVTRRFRNVVLEQLRQPMTVAASYGVFGGTPRQPDGGEIEDLRALREQAEALIGSLKQRLAEAGARDPRLESTAERPVSERVDTQTERLETLFGDGFTVLPPFEPQNGREVRATFTDDELVPDGRRLAAETLLQRTASFSDRIDRFREARSYAEALSGRLTPQPTVGQLPYREGETWVGVDGVDPQPSVLSLVAQFGPGASPASVDGRLTGLLVDEWTESVPSGSETTGVALNYDDPGSRAPQSVLLATPPEDGSWSLDDLAATVAETATYVKRRGLDLSDLSESAFELLPGLFFPDYVTDEDVSPPAGHVDFESIGTYDQNVTADLLELLNTGGATGNGTGRTTDGGTSQSRRDRQSQSRRD